MAINWSEDQLKAIEHRDKNMLVSAAAGSGKTAVLVERIISMITDPVKNTDLDRMLVVTFTKAAAAQMKERIRKTLDEFIKKQPENEELRRQSVLIHNANISTIHSFCSWIIKNYFYLADIDPMFRVMDDGESKLMKSDCIREIIEEAIAHKDREILNFLLSFETGKNTSGIEKTILEIYDRIIAEPWPREWIKEKRDQWTCISRENIEKNPCVQEALNKASENLSEALKTAAENMQLGALMRDKIAEITRSDLEAVENCCKCTDYDSIRKALSDNDLNLGKVKKAGEDDPVLLGKVKANRKKTADLMRELTRYCFTDPLETMVEDFKRVSGHVKTLCDLLLKFDERFSEKKRKSNLMDYNDLEHFALNILVKRNEDGTADRTDAAKEIAAGFDQIITDEYQDSNIVQEWILDAVSGNIDGINNRFMVGDIKQSIYGFRHAEPKLFTDKYKDYRKASRENEVVDLSANYRSRRQVLDTVNLYFGKLMNEKFGGVEYNANQQLNYGADYPEGDPSDYTTEILLLDKKDPDIDNPKNRLELIENEAALIAGKIRSLKESFKVWDMNSRQFRELRYSDCAILLRSGNDYFETITKVLQNKGIPAAAASRTGYFETVEVKLILDYLRILDNPLQDIPFTAVLMSCIGGLNTEELAEVRISRKKGRMYPACLEYSERGSDSALKEKLGRFFRTYTEIRNRAVYISVSRLISEIFEATGIRSYAAAMPAGLQRVANLDMLMEKAADYEKTSYKGLFNFVRYIEELQKSEEDFGEAAMSFEGADAVRILTIHKSKGLEFPVVFIAGMGKQFNNRDLNKSILIHREYGIGMDLVDYEGGKEKKSCYKAMIRRKLEYEMKSEELRVLYVAMTRAKEKLIIVRNSGDLTKEIENCLNDSDLWKGRVSIGTASAVKGIGSWLLPVLSGYDCFGNAARWAGLETEEFREKCDFIKIEITSVDKLITDEADMMRSIENNLKYIPVKDNAEVFERNVNALLSDIEKFEYGYKAEVMTPEKISVSQLKRYEKHDEEQDGTDARREIPQNDKLIPAFIRDKEEKLSGALRGTAYHEFWKYLDYSMLPSPSLKHPSLYGAFEKMLQQMLKNGHLDKAEAECIHIEDMITFINSELGQRMHEADLRGELFRERPFVMSIRACDADPGWESREQLLVQGIIDAYFYEKDEIVLIDYKTDRVETESELIERYRPQLDMYKRALESNTGKKVKEIMIYSTVLKNCVIL